MKVKEDDIIWLTVVAIISGCVVILAILAALIMLRFEEPATGAIQGSVLLGVGSLVLVVLWFLVKALLAHMAGHWLFKRIALWRAERNDRKWTERERAAYDDDEDFTFPGRSTRLTRPGESLIEKEHRDGKED